MGYEVVPAGIVAEVALEGGLDFGEGLRAEFAGGEAAIGEFGEAFFVAEHEPFDSGNQYRRAAWQVSFFWGQILKPAKGACVGSRNGRLGFSWAMLAQRFRSSSLPLRG